MLKLIIAIAVIALVALLLAGCVERMFFHPDSAPWIFDLGAGWKLGGEIGLGLGH